MADPLSIAASVVGLLAAAGKVYGVLSNFVASTADAPSSAASTLEAVGHMKFTLSSVQSLIESLDSLESSRKALIQLDHLSIVITHSVLTISKLESIVCLKDGLMHRLRWVWNERRVLGLLPRLESQKNSLALMVAVLQSKSDAEALSSHDRLLAKVDEILQQNEALAQRLQRLEGGHIPDNRSVKFLDGVPSRVSHPLSLSNVEIASLPSPELLGQPSTAISNPTRITRSSFEVDLEQSRVHNRTQRNESDVSFTTSTAPANAWSMFSGMSLNDISILSVFQLPITLDDISLVAPGSTFSILPTEQLAAPTSTPVIENAELNEQDVRQAVEEGPERRTTQTTERGNTESRLFTSTLGASQVKKGIKVVVVGDSNAFKVEMLQTYARGEGAKARALVVESFMVEIKVGTHLMSLALWDTTGLRESTGLRTAIYPGADSFLVVTQKKLDESFNIVEKKWIPEITRHCPGTPFLIAATHTHRPQATGAMSQRLVAGDQIAERTGAVAYIECDVDEVDSVRAVFTRAIAAAMRGDKRPSRPGNSLMIKLLKPLTLTRTNTTRLVADGLGEVDGSEHPEL